LAFANKSKSSVGVTFSTRRNSLCSRPSGPMIRAWARPRSRSLAQLFDIGRAFMRQIGFEHCEMFRFLQDALVAERGALHLAAWTAPFRREINKHRTMIGGCLLDFAAAYGSKATPPSPEAPRLSHSGLVIQAATAISATPNTRFTDTSTCRISAGDSAIPKMFRARRRAGPVQCEREEQPPAQPRVAGLADKRSSATTNGARHGAAITPITAPKKNTPM